MLRVENLHVTREGSPILRGIDLVVNAGEVHAIMGPNGSGKSTLSHVIAGKPGYEITAGSVAFRGASVTEMAPDARARAGIFLAFQYPVEVPGVNNAYFLKAALNARRKERGEEELDAVDFLVAVRAKMKALQMDAKFLQRPVNEGFSGGEKKRNEILQMAVLEPHLCLLDETDSGLDIDALRIVSQGINALRTPERAMVLVTHYQRLLDYVVPDVVHVLAGGRIVRTGGPELARELEDRGYGEQVERGGKAARPAPSSAAAAGATP